MPTQVALLRGINVGGRNLVAMSELRAMFEALGFGRVKTLLQSGNVVFQTARRNGESLERFLEKETEKCFKKSIDYVVRNAAECDSVVARNPFPEAAALTPGHLLVFFLKQAPEREGVRTLETRIRAVNGPEVIHADNKQLYIMYPEGIGTSKLTGAVIEKSLGVRGTARNWNTVLKFTALSHSND